MITLGLTGGIGSGKSAAAAILEGLGATRIDADEVGHEVYLPGKPCWQELVTTFGREIIAADGTIDRKKLGALVFPHPPTLSKLNELVQPRIASEIADRIRTWRAQGAVSVIVVEAAVLIEAGWQWLVDQIWLVETAPELAIERVMRSRGLTRHEVERRMASQASDFQRSREASCVIRNNGTLDDLRAEIERLWREQVAPSVFAARS